MMKRQIRNGGETNGEDEKFQTTQFKHDNCDEIS